MKIVKIDFSTFIAVLANWIVLFNETFFYSVAVVSDSGID
jgi:hypothetical protein